MVNRVLVWYILAATLGAADLRVDHVTIAGQNLAAMRAKLDAIGLRSEYGGKHSNHATEMASISFPDGSYLELIAIQADADPAAVKAHYWAKQMQGNAGPCAWAVRSSDLLKDADALRKNSVEVSAPLESGRTRTDGTRLDWRTARVGPEPNGTFFPFLIQDLTERALRAFPNGVPISKDFQGVAHVVIGVTDLKAGVERYRKAFSLPAPVAMTDPSFGGRMVKFLGTPVILAEGAGDGPVAFILTKNGGKTVTWFDRDKLGWRLGVE
jgi:hypothetical protein